MSVRRPLVTIAIPTFNRSGTYLPQALGCALAQTYHDIEIIVSDNCSTDRTSEVVANYRDSRIRYLRHAKPVVPNDNFNFCLSQARGEYLLLLLDDELVDADFVSTCMDAAMRMPAAGLIRTGLRVIDANGAFIQELPNGVAGRSLDELFLGWFAGDTALYLCNTLFQTECLRAVGGLRSRHNLFQDVMAQVKVLAASTRIDIKAAKATTRRHSNQFTYSAKVTEWCEDSLDLLKLICELLPNHEKHVRRRGMRFFANIGYSRANAIQSPAKRVAAYAQVWRIFGFRYLPSLRLALANTSLHSGLRQIKHKLFPKLVWED